MNWTKTALCAGALALMPGVAAAWTAWNGSTVNPVSNTVFEVVAGPVAAHSGFWCAAGDYARRVLNAPMQQRIFVVSGRGPAVTENRMSAVQFSFYAPEGAGLQSNVLLSVSQVGNNMSVFAAWNFCAESRRAYN